MGFVKLSDYLSANGDMLVDPEKVKAARYTSPVFLPDNGAEYFYLTGSGRVESDENDGTWVDAGRAETGNCFPDRGAAEFAAERRKIEARLQRLALESGPVDFSDGGTTKYLLVYSHEPTGTGNLVYEINQYRQSEGAAYFATEEALDAAVTEIGAERIKKYLFGVEGEG